MCGISHEDHLAILEDPLLVRQSVVKGPATRLIFHERNQFLHHWIPVLVNFKDLRLWRLGNPRFSLGRVFVARRKGDDVENMAVRGDGISCLSD